MLLTALQQGHHFDIVRLFQFDSLTSQPASTVTYTVTAYITATCCECMMESVCVGVMCRMRMCVRCEV